MNGGQHREGEARGRIRKSGQEKCESACSGNFRPQGPVLQLGSWMCDFFFFYVETLVSRPIQVV